VIVDLHTHSSESDGSLSPAQLVRRAAARGVGVLALTDHDTTAGVAEAQRVAAQLGVRLLPGVEISTDWEGTTLHVIGLNIDAANRALQAGLAHTREGRMERARAISRSLAKAGIDGALAGAMRQAGEVSSVSSLGRMHFARFLVALGCARTASGVFDHYMTKGKPGHVEHRWAPLDEVLAWIKGAGGQAVLAHPWRYGLRAGDQARLARALHDLGGDALELAPDDRRGRRARHHASMACPQGLNCSLGSDFHVPGEGHDLGIPGSRTSLAWAGIEGGSSDCSA